MAGYYGKSMSNNAVEAYMRGEKPMSKWTKRVILDALQMKMDSGIPTKVNIKELQKFKLPQLKILFLVCCGWHHTYSKFYRTDFYGIREDRLNCTADELKELLKTEAGEKEY